MLPTLTALTTLPTLAAARGRAARPGNGPAAG